MGLRAGESEASGKHRQTAQDRARPRADPTDPPSPKGRPDRKVRDSRRSLELGRGEWQEKAMREALPAADCDLLPIAEAAGRAGISRQALLQRLRKRGITPIRQVAAGHARSFLTVEQLAAAMDSADPVATSVQPKEASCNLGATSVQRLATVELAPDDRITVAQLQLALQVAEAARVKAEAMLAAAERIERSTAARCDKLESKLDAATERNTQLRADLAAAQATAEHFRNQSQAMIAAESRQLRIAAGRSWWPFGR